MPSWLTSHLMNTLTRRPSMSLLRGRSGRSSPPSATAMPSPVVPLDRSMDSWVCSVHTLLPRDLASRIVWIVSNGVLVWTCLLYTSDAADDLTRVDLGGRRIITK